MKVSDNDGPRPSDRVFYSYNQYVNVNGSVNPPGTPEITFRRQIVGLETMIGDDASIGARLPFLQMAGSPELTDREVGDITIVGKYAFINDPWTGNVATLGLSVTLPTGGRGGLIGSVGDGADGAACGLRPAMGRRRVEQRRRLCSGNHLAAAADGPDLPGRFLHQRRRWRLVVSEW